MEVDHIFFRPNVDRSARRDPYLRGRGSQPVRIVKAIQDPHAFEITNVVPVMKRTADSEIDLQGVFVAPVLVMPGGWERYSQHSVESTRIANLAPIALPGHFPLLQLTKEASALAPRTTSNRH